MQRTQIIWNPHVCLVAQSCPTICHPVGYNPPGSSVHGDSPGKNTGVSAMLSSRGSCQPRDWTQISRIPDSSLSEPRGKPTYPTSNLIQCIWAESGLNLRLCSPRPHYMVYQASYALREWVPKVSGWGLTNCLLLIPTHSWEALGLVERQSVILASGVCVFWPNLQC